jgi:branched-chain amino acid transport system ATP-binding protein
MKNQTIPVTGIAVRPHFRRRFLGLGTSGQLFTAALMCIGACALILTLNSYYVFVMATIAITAIVGVGLNVLLGLTGQVSFGHVAFYAIGAYVVGVLTTTMGWSFWLAWPVAALVAGMFGMLLALPALRAKGPYLAMITIAFSFIVQHAIVEMRGVTGGQNGIMGIMPPAFGGIVAGEQGIAILAFLALAAVLAMFTWLSRGTWGAAMRAVRDSETASESIGLNPLVIKAVAFTVSALLAGLAGGLFAPLSGFVSPDVFSFMQSILFLLVVVVGGSGSVAGPLVGALIVGILPEMLSGLADYRLLFFGALLLLVLWIAPDGVVGSVQNFLKSRRDKLSRPGSIDPPLMSDIALSKRARKPLQANSISMVFGGVRAVDKLSFAVKPAAITSLIGPNGAGKSTVLNMLSGFYQPTSGAFSLEGNALQGLAAFRIARQGIARTYQTSQLFETLSVDDNVALAVSRGRLGGLLNAARFDSPKVRGLSRQLLAYCGYLGALDVPAADLAHVDRRLVEIARALATDPDVLLLDEPAAGLSSEDKQKLARLLRRIADAGVSIALVEHDMTLVMNISDQIVVLDAGQRLAIGTPADIQHDPVVRQAYLGESGLLDGDTSARSKRAATTDAPELLGVGKLVTGYGAEPVLHGVDLQVRRGEMVALLGANGAGKSTLMRSLAGLQRPVGGGIHFEGNELSSLSADAIVAKGLVLVPEGRQVFGDLSVLDNIRLGAFLDPSDMDSRVEEMLVRFPRLRERLHQRAGLLSGGEQQMLAIARGLMSRPRILLLDEPSLGLAPKVIAELFDTLDRLREEKMTILLVDQMAALALALADRAYVLEGGRVVAHGSAADIAGNDALAKAYLGATSV